MRTIGCALFFFRGMSNNTEYIPGTCNIGPAEIAKRKRMGYWLIVLNLVLVFVFLNNDIPRLFRWLMVLPLATAAATWLQIFFRFCVAFGWYGVFNFGALSDKKTRVKEDEWAKADRQKAQQIVLLAALIAFLLSAAFYFL